MTFSANGQVAVAWKKVGNEVVTLYSLHTNHLGSVMAVGNAGGGIVTGSYAAYEPFGAFLVPPTETNPSVTDRGFTGHRHNNLAPAWLGLVYMNARYYHPQMGRFISPDSIVPEPGNPQSFNRYAYTLNNPIKYNDPSGHWFESVLDLASIAYDIYDIRQNGLNWTNGLSLAADVGSLALPVVTGGGLAVRALAHADDVADVVIHVDEAVDTARVLEDSVAAGRTADNLFDATRAGEGATQIAQKRVVIGEGMDAVRTAGREHGAKWYQAWSKNFEPENFDLDKSLARQERWIRGKVNEGYEILDIGIDPNRAQRSPFYQLEKKILGELNYPSTPIPRPR